MDSALTARLERVDALQKALRDGRPRPDRMTAWYCASALLDVDAAPEDIAVAVRERRQAIIDALGGSRAPTGEMRWAYAALLTARDVPVEMFARQRSAVRQKRSSAKAYRKAGSLHAGGSRAALVLAACGQAPEPGAAAFLEMKAALKPPWWRASPGVTDLYSAAHAAKGDAPRVVAQARERAVEVFRSDKRARGHKHAGARACALFEAEPRTVLRRFHALDDRRKSIKDLRHRVQRDMLIDWAAQGLEPDDLNMIAQTITALPRHLGSIATGRSRLAHLLVTHGRAGNEFGEISALAAIIAAQTAALVAVMAATTSATTAATAGS